MNARFRLALAVLVPAAVALAADPKPGDQPAAPGDDKIDSVESAAQRLKEQAVQIGLAEANKLDFAQCKELFGKLSPVRPFLSGLDKHTRPHAVMSMISISLLAGEPAAAVECINILFADKDVKLDDKARTELAYRGFFASLLAGDDKLAKSMLTRMDFAIAKQIGQHSDILGRKLPAFRLDLMDGKSVRVSGSEDRVLVLNCWMVLQKDQHKPLLAPMLELDKKYNGCAGFGIIGINMNFAGERGKVTQCIRDEKLRWPHVFDGKGPESPMCKSLGTAGWLGALVIGPDNRVLYKGGPGDTPATWAINFGLRQIEKKRSPVKPPPLTPPAASQPVENHPTTPAPPTANPPGPVANPAEQKFNLAETYRAAGLTDKANDLLRELIREHPDSFQAAKARQMLGVDATK